MEEEEDTKKMQKRKRKSRKDLSPDMVVPPESDEEIPEPEEKKKKRGRKKKIRIVQPEDAEELTDLQRLFKIIEHLMSNKGSEAFMERPDDSMYGMSDYYELITKPMWLREVERKYKAGEYATPTELVADVRLMLENCYHYWGPKDTLSQRALKLEQTFENKLATLTPELQKLCSLEATHGDMVKEEPDDNVVKSGNKKGGFVSKLLNWVMNGRGNAEGDAKQLESSQEAVGRAKRAEREAAETVLSVWEEEHLLSPAVKEQIISMWEFPVIGQFLHLVYNVLNIDPISHLELERMLLMPQASKTLATLVTSMLIPPLFRAKLEVGPAMPYCVWSRRLHTKVSGWYRTYHSKGDSTVEVHTIRKRVFDTLGIEPQFWLILGEENPLDEYAFHELTFHQRVWLLKGLCDFIMHNHKTIQDCINTLEMEELREQNLGRDKEGYSYHYFHMFTEVRIYKMAKVPDNKWKSYEGGVEEAIMMCAEEDDDEDQAPEQNFIGFSRRPLHKPPRSMRPQHSDFKLVCQSLEEVRALVNKFCDADPLSAKGEGKLGKLVTNLKSIISTLESREHKMDLAVFNVRKRMKKEWTDHKDRSKDYLDPGIAYWERKEKEEKRATEESAPDLAFPGTSSDNHIYDDEKRERRARRESSLKLLSREENGRDDDESAEESPLDFDDNSEDEWFASKKDKENKKKKRMSAKKHRKPSDIIDKMQHTIPGKDKEIDRLNLNSSFSGFQSSVSVKVANKNHPQEPLVKVKQEPFDDFSSQSSNSSTPSKRGAKSPRQDHITATKEPSTFPTQGIRVKQEFSEEQLAAPPNNSLPTNVLQSLVRPVANVKLEKALKAAPITPDLSKLKRSTSPDDVVYISDSEDLPDIKPNPALLQKQITPNKVVETLNYSMSIPAQQPLNSFLVSNTVVPNQFVPVNVAPGDQVFNAQPQVFNVAQPAGQPLTFQVPNAQTMPVMQQPIIRPNQSEAPRPNLNANQKFLVIQQPTANNVNQPNQFVNKGPRAPGGNFPTTPTMQNVNWFSPRGSPQAANFAPRQRGASPRGRGSPRGPTTPTRGVQRFAGRTPTNSPRTPTSMMRTPSPMTRTPSPMRGRGITTPVRQAGPVRNLNFNRSPAKPPNKPVNDIPESPDIEGTLVVSMTDTGGFGYVVMLPDGGKISLTSDQLAKIRSDNGGVLPKTCKVPLNMQNDCFRID